MVDGAKVLEAIYSIAAEKQIDKEIVIEGIKEGFQKAYEKYFDPEAIIRVLIDEQTGQLKVSKELTVVQKIEDEWLEISLVEAKQRFGENVTIDDVVYEEVEFTEEFSRLAILQFSQIIKQKIREGEKDSIYEKFYPKLYDIVGGLITDTTENSFIVDVDGSLLSIWEGKMIPGEKVYEGSRISFYIEDVNRESKFSQIITSRIHPQFLVKLMETEVPELQEGIIEIKAASRNPGVRAKIAVTTYDTSVDPIGSCVGAGGSRIKNVTKELNGEKIDVVLWDEDKVQFIINALSPVKVLSITYDEEENEATVIVPNEQLSLAIGKKGMAAKLVARLVDSRINIFSQEVALEKGIEVLWNGNMTEEQLANFQPRNKTFVNNKKTFVPKKDNYIEIEKEFFESESSIDDIEANRMAFETIAEEEEIKTDIVSENPEDYEEYYGE